MSLPSKQKGIFEAVVHTIMGVKPDDTSLQSQRDTGGREMDWSVTARYLGGTVLQVVAMVVVLWGLEQFNLRLSERWSAGFAIGFFALVSVRSRLFSILDNTRNGNTYRSVEQPHWAPPPLAFPVVWMTIGVLRVISSYLVWQATGQHYVSLPLILFMAHLSLGDTWNTIFTVERRLGAAVPMVLMGPLMSSIVVTVAYWQINPLAGYLLVPMCLWLIVASVLVFEIWKLNGCEPFFR